MSASGIRTLVAVTALAVIIVGVQPQAIQSPSSGDADSAASRQWQQTRMSVSGSAQDAEETGVIERTAVRLCIAYVGASRRDHNDDRRLRRECAERVGVDLAALDR